jgi:hypothetical protein
MLASLLLALSLQQSPGLDSAHVYAAILTHVRAGYPELPIVLSETRAGVACMPHCGAILRDADAPAPGAPAPTPSGDHSPRLLHRLHDLGLIEATCPVEARMFGCRSHPGHLFVALGEIEDAPSRGPQPEAGGMWVRAAFLVPCIRDCRERVPDEPYFPDAFGLWFLLKCGADGAWEVVRTVPAFSV